MEEFPSATANFNAPIRLGYVPLVDAAPLIVAKEFGLFSARGISVDLVRQPGWATVRDELCLGRELDGAHALAGLAFVTTYGIQCMGRHCVTGMILNRHGNGVTLSMELAEAGVRKISDLHPDIRGYEGRKLRLGVVHPASSHHHLLRSLFGRQGMTLSEHAEVIVLPPELMSVSLERRMIDGFCAGEPWNSVAIKSGAGFCLSTSEELCDSHPEKILLVTDEFASVRPEEHLLLIDALLEACEICDDPEQRPDLVRLLCTGGYLDLPEEVVANSLCGKFHRGFEQYSPVSSIHQFSGESVNRPTRAQADLVLSQLRGCVPLPQGSPGELPKPDEIFREDLYEAALSQNNKPAALPA